MDDKNHNYEKKKKHIWKIFKGQKEIQRKY